MMLSSSGHISETKGCLWEAPRTAALGARRRLLTAALSNAEAAPAIGFELERAAPEGLKPLAELNRFSLDGLEETARRIVGGTLNAPRAG